MTIRMPHRVCVVSGVLVAALLISSCGSAGRGPYSADGSQYRDIRKAEECYQRSIGVVEKDPEKAELLLREALGFDLYHGSAHNNLGVLLLNQGKLYDAAGEFEWARKLMPGNPEPRVNLAIVLDRGGKHLDALDAAQAALEVSPGDLSAIQALALIQVREGLVGDQTAGYLDAIIQRSDDLRWTDWARDRRDRQPDHRSRD